MGDVFTKVKYKPLSREFLLKRGYCCDNKCQNCPYKTTKMDKIKNYLYNIAMKSPLRKWALSLTGWKWWVWQLVVGGIILVILEYLLNLIGLTLLPWR